MIRVLNHTMLVIGWNILTSLQTKSKEEERREIEAVDNDSSFSYTVIWCCSADPYYKLYTHNNGFEVVVSWKSINAVLQKSNQSRKREEWRWRIHPIWTFQPEDKKCWLLILGVRGVDDNYKCCNDGYDSTTCKNYGITLILYDFLLT